MSTENSVVANTANIPTPDLGKRRDNSRLVGNSEVMQKRASMKLAGLVSRSQLLGSVPASVRLNALASIIFCEFHGLHCESNSIRSAGSSNLSPFQPLCLRS